MSHNVENEMGQIDAIMKLEEGEFEDEQDYAITMQETINGLDGWRMQGSMGRAMMDAITSGQCMLGKCDTRDYYGNHIPSRDQVKAGTKGSYDYVVAHCGKDHADALAAL